MLRWSEFVTNSRDDSHSGLKKSGKALTKALRRLPTGGWDSRYSRQGLSALFSSDKTQVIPFNPAPRSDDQPKKIDRRKAAKFAELAIALPDVRARRVAELRSQINSGEYSIDSSDLADRLLDEWKSEKPN